MLGTALEKAWLGRGEADDREAKLVVPGQMQGVGAIPK